MSQFIPFRIDFYDYRAICLFFACVVYALAGSPTPDHIGFPEIVIAVLLALSIGVSSLRDILAKPAGLRFWKSTGQVFLVYGLSVPLIVGALRGHDLGAIVRDVFPFLCLFLPLFCLSVIRARPQYFRTTLLGIILIGLVFSLRSLVMRFDVSCRFDLWCANDELLYLENMPTVLFSCLLLLGSAVVYATRAFNVRNMVVFCGLAGLALLPIAAMVLTLQRASVGALVFYIVYVYAYFFYRSPAKALKALLIGGAAFVVVGLSFDWVFASLWEKTRVVGFNMRAEEYMAVWEVITRDPLVFLFGTGWGGHFNSPAVGGLSVNFTHNFFSSMLLKCGVIGTLLCAGYIAGILERLPRVILKNPVFGMALCAPILIDLTFYASFKSLDFGLMLLMVPGSLVYFRQHRAAII